MAKLTSVLFNSLPLAAHCRFMTRVSTEVSASSVIITALGTMVDAVLYVADG
jgi:hypothetical protein